jgi:hypothetical protein
MLPFQIRQWIGSGGESDHSPVWLELEGTPQKSAAPFKFNSSWINDERFQQLIRTNWTNLRETKDSPTGIQFAPNLKHLKKLVIPWAKPKQLSEEQEVQTIEEKLILFQEDLETTFLSVEAHESLKTLEARRRILLAEQENSWRLKSIAIWLEKGDKNKKLFQAYTKGRKAENTISSLKDQEGRTCSTFEGLANLGKNHFQTLFKADRNTNITEIIKMVLYLPSFVNEQGNQALFVEVTKDELKETIQSFQKDKSPDPEGWTIEFFRGFFDLIGKDLLKVIEES